MLFYKKTIVPSKGTERSSVPKQYRNSVTQTTNKKADAVSNTHRGVFHSATPTLLKLVFDIVHLVLVPPPHTPGAVY